MWDVEESTDGVLTSKKSESTILAKYFSDFVNNKNEMKLVEDAKVTASGALTSAIGTNQVKIEADGISSFINAENPPRRNKEVVTYEAGSDAVVAYVPAEVANIANLSNKTVDVIFGKDNEVAYIVVTDDAVEAAYVTAFDYIDQEIEINGEEYDIASDVEVRVFGYKYVTAVDPVTGVDTQTGLNKIDTILTALGANDTKNVKRNVLAEITLNADDEIETINFKFSKDWNETIITKVTVTRDEDGEPVSAATTTAVLKVDEYIVEKISDKNVITAQGRATKLNIEDVEEDDDPRVIRNGEIATLYDITEGDVITEVKLGSDIVTLVAVANTVEGTMDEYTAKTNLYEIDGEEYMAAPSFFNENGEVDDFAEESDAAVVFNSFVDKDITAYLNMAGEVVAIVGESEALGNVLGVVISTVSEFEDEDQVWCLKVRILAEDGTNKVYKIYNKTAGKDLTTSDVSLAIGDLVKFTANDERVIKSDKIEALEAYDYDADDNKTYSLKGGNNLKAIKVAKEKIDIDVTNGNKLVDKTPTEAAKYRYTSSTVVMNPAEKELITKWDTLVKDGAVATGVGAAGTDHTEAWYLVDNNGVLKYVVAWVAEANYGTTTDQFGILTAVTPDRDENDERIYVATVLVDGVKETFNCVRDTKIRNYELGDFIQFKVSDGEIKEDSLNVLVAKDFSDVLAEIVDPEGTAIATGAYDAENSKFVVTTKVDALTLAYLQKLGFVTVANNGTEDDESDDTLTSAKYVAMQIAEGGIDVNEEVTYVYLTGDATPIKLAKDYIVYDLSAGEEIQGIEEENFILFAKPNADTEYEIVIVL